MSTNKKKRMNSSKARSMDRKSMQAVVRTQRKSRGKRNQYYQDVSQVMDVESNEIFAFIAGYTDGGFAFGITWVELEQMADEESLFATLPPEEIPAWFGESSRD